MIHIWYKMGECAKSTHQLIMFYGKDGVSKFYITFLGVFSSELTHFLLVKVNIWFSNVFWLYINHNTIGSLVFNACFLVWKRPTLTVFITVLLLVTLHNTCYQVGKNPFFNQLCTSTHRAASPTLRGKWKQVYMTLSWGTIQVMLCCGYCLQFNGQVIEPSLRVRRALDHEWGHKERPWSSITHVELFDSRWSSKAICGAGSLEDDKCPVCTHAQRCGWWESGGGGGRVSVVDGSVVLRMSICRTEGEVT